MRRLLAIALLTIAAPDVSAQNAPPVAWPRQIDCAPYWHGESTDRPSDDPRDSAMESIVASVQAIVSSGDDSAAASAKRRADLAELARAQTPERVTCALQLAANRWARPSSHPTSQAYEWAARATALFDRLGVSDWRRGRRWRGRRDH